MTGARHARWAAVILWAAAAFSGCSEPRDRDEPTAVYADVAPILDTKCVECHGASRAEAGYRVDDYFNTIRCIPDPTGPPATLPPDQTAPILAKLGDEDHADFLNEAENDALTTWVVAGAFPASRGSHPGQWNDPRAPDWHGAYLRDTEWLPLVDSSRGDACARCHAGSPAPVEGVTNFAPGATDCTACHDLPGGVMACGTCHGDGLRAYPPRDPCYFPGPPEGYAHAAHAEPSANNPSGLDCQACHFGQDYEMLDGSHANGDVDVVFHPAWGPDASYAVDTMRCTTSCHARGGTTPIVGWNEQLNVECQSCHQNPPEGHSTIACNNCHRGINASGTRLTSEAPHINGRVDAF